MEPLPGRYSVAEASSPQSKKCDASWIATRLEMLMGAYRQDQFASPQSFAAQAAMVLERYPKAVIETVTSPITGLQRKLKWPPSLAELSAECDSEKERLSRGPPLTKRIEPRKAEMPEPGKDYFSLFEKHGRPTGPFEKGRQLPYRGF